MMESRKLPRVLKWLNHYFTIFLLVAFVITCCTMLFLSTLSETMYITWTAENLSAAARLTFWNVVLLSLIFSVIDGLRRKLLVQRPAQRITEAAEKIIQGDFSVRIPPQSMLLTDESFHQIIPCFNKMAQELGSVETLRTDFISNVSHEMKTPLAVMQNYAALLQQAGLEEEKRVEYARAITSSSRKLADMMTNILKLNRLENQQIFPQATEFDLGEQLCECLLSYESVWEQSGIAIETDLEENVRVKADAELLSLVWNNLFSNAFKFTKTGGTVSLEMSTAGQYAIVQVKDTGCGMTPEVGAHIFEKFYQGDRSHAAQGNGLGLALVKRVIDILHGEIHVESIQGVGSTFTVKIRRAGYEH